VNIRDRLVGLDAVRILGIIAIVAGHVWAVGTVRDLLFAWHVPVFFFLSGYLWVEQRSVAVEFGKRWKSLLVPYLMWLAIIAAAQVIEMVAAGSTPTWSYFANLLKGGAYVGRPFTAFWFLTALFIATILYRLISRLPLWARWAIALATLSVAYLWPEMVRWIPLSAGTAAACLVFIVAGHTLAQVKSHRVAIFVAASIVGLAFLVLVGRHLASPVDLKKADFGTPGIAVIGAIAISAALVVGATRFMPALGARLSRAITILARAGVVVILTHPVILWILNTPSEGSRVAFALAIVVPWAVGVGITFTPLSPLLAGVPRERFTQRQAVPAP
jgi:fucose 4-O-acetylase-like acetyltransferase